MATCKFISKIKNVSSQSKAVNYTKNKSKTHNESYAQEKALSYVTNESKTRNDDWLNSVYQQDGLSADGEKEFFVTGIMCTKENAHQRMLAAQKMSDKPIVNYAYHAEQSFLEGAGEMTPEAAHEIGVRLARELWGDEFMVLISTHLNTDHYHNHFIICSTSPITGRRFHECPAAWRAMCEKSDELCREYGLNTLEHAPTKTHKRTGAEIAMEKNGIPTHRDILKNDCDIAIAQAACWSDFLSNLRKMGYCIHQSNAFINLSLDDWSRPVRIYFDESKTRSLGAEYTKPAIERRIAQNSKTDKELRDVDILPKVAHARYKGSLKNAKGKPAGLSVTYYRITYKLCIVSMPGRPRRKRRMSVYMRNEVGKMNRYLDEIRLLRRTGIQTVSGVQLYKANAENKMQALTEQRHTLRNKRRTCKSRDDEIPIRNEISKLTKEIAALRKHIKLCDDIIENSESVKAAADNDSLCELERYREFSPEYKKEQTINKNPNRKE